jgi:hypothetical protein
VSADGESAFDFTVSESEEAEVEESARDYYEVVHREN